MAAKTTTEHRVPFNLRGEDAVKFLRLRKQYEKKTNTRLSAVQVMRMLLADVAESVSYREVGK